MFACSCVRVRRQLVRSYRRRHTDTHGHTRTHMDSDTDIHTDTDTDTDIHTRTHADTDARDVSSVLKEQNEAELELDRIGGFSLDEEGDN